MNAATMEFITDAQVKHEAELQAPTHQATEQPLKQRVRATGHRHGKAFGNIGVVTTSYSKGFFEGVVDAFKD